MANRGLRLLLAVLLLAWLPALQAGSPGKRSPGAKPVKGLPETPRVGPKPLATGGPDGFGYTYVDQGGPAGPTYSFVDISGTGTAVTFTDSDDGAATVTLGAPILFYGASVGSLAMSTNGYLSTDDTDFGGDLSNDCPLPTAPDAPFGSTGARMYVFHDDLVVNGGGFTQFFGTCPVTPLAGGSEACTVLMWQNVTRYGQGDAFDFEAILFHASNEIRYQYQSLGAADGGGQTVGIQSAGPSPLYGLAYACNLAASVTSTTAVSFVAPPPARDLMMSKSVLPASATLGGTVTYTLGVTNAGPLGQTGVVVTDTLPAGLSYVSNSCGASFAAGTLTWSVGSLANGASASCQLVATVTTCDLIENVATVTGAAPDPAANNKASAVLNATTQLVDDPSFEAGRFAGRWAEVSANFASPVCSFGLCGTGGGAAGPRTGTYWTWLGGCTDTCTLPETASVGQSITIPATGRAALRFHLWIGAAGNAADTFTVRIDGAPVFTTSATNPAYAAGYVAVTVNADAYADGASHALLIEGTQTTSVTTNFNVDDVGLVACVVPADVSLTKTTAATNVSVGQSVTFTLTAANAGPGAATAVVVTDVLPAGLVYVSNTCGASFAAGTLTWNVGTLAFPGSASCDLVATMAAGPLGVVTNTATVSNAAAPDPQPANDSASASVTLLGSDLSMTKTPSAANVLPNQAVTYTLTVTNNGPGSAPGVVVTDVLPAGLVYVSNSCGASFAAGTLTWNVGTLAFPGSASCSLDVTVANGFYGLIANTATASTTGVDPTAANNSGTGPIVSGAPITEVPTLGGWGLLALLGSLALAGLFALRRLE